jgi:glycine/D-amino acid oxidase-like deaminating enzyme
LIRWTGEAEVGHPYWWDERHTRPELTTTPPPKTEVLVVGAGYTGLSAAIAAHDAGAKVVVVDAGEPGQGASTRNGGMFGAHPRLGWAELAKAFGPATADGLFGEATPALNFLKSLIADENIDCDLVQTGRIQLAWTKDQFESQKQLVNEVTAKSDVSINLVQRTELAAEIRTDQYFGGVVFPEHCAIHPKKFHDGLLAAVLRRDIPVVRNCAVEAVDRSGAGFAATTTKGGVGCDKIILATNGYTTSAFRWYQRRVFPLSSYLIATEELPSALINQLAPGKRMMVETRARRSYFRVSPDGKRLLFGGRASMRDIPLTIAAERLRATMCEVWPQLADRRLSHVWSGNTGYSFSHMPTVGENDGMHFAMGFSGSGTVMAPYLGAKAGLRALGDPKGETAYAQTALRTSWLHPFKRPHFLAAADIWYRRVVDRRENKTGRRS